MSVQAWLATLRRRRPSRIGIRLFAFNLLVVFVPVAGILYLDVYEKQLLDAQERGMAQQARLVAAALSGPSIDPAHAAAVLQRIEDLGDVRIQIYDAGGALVQDSARFSLPVAAGPAPYVDAGSRRRRVLYRVGTLIVRARDLAGRIARRILGWQDPPPSAESGAMLPEVQAALAGRRYAAASRQTPGQRSLTLNSAVPVRHEGRVVGAVVVSQTTFRILQALYDVRLRLFEIVLLSLAAATLLTRLASSTIVNPLVRLQQAAAALTSRRKELSGFFSRIDRKDEIGDLARSLEELARRLDDHIKLLESFTADVSHELKNPLAAIRTAAETIADSSSVEERQRFLSMLLRDVDRLERLVSGVREMAQIDARLSTEGRDLVDLTSVLSQMHDALRASSHRVAFDVPSHPVLVLGSADRIRQVVENLVANATSFSPAGDAVDVRLAASARDCVIAVADRGPGIPENHLERIFDRFFSYRPDSDRRAHMGLGLAIARAIVVGYDGMIAARNRAGGGAIVEVRLPLAGVEAGAAKYN